MQKFYMILGAVVLTAVAVFAAMNSGIVPVKLLFLGEINQPAYILILSCFFTGAILMAILDLGRHFRSWTEIRRLKKEISSLHEERELLKKRISELKGKTDEPWMDDSER